MIAALRRPKSKKAKCRISKGFISLRENCLSRTTLGIKCTARHFPFVHVYIHPFRISRVTWRIRGFRMRIGFLAFVLLACSPFVAAQDNCPEGFRFVGTLSGTGTDLNPFDKRQAVKLPENATLDESFQQKNVRVTNRKSGAHSNMQASDIPRGILVITHGDEDEVYQPGWAVSAPELKAI